MGYEADVRFKDYLLEDSYVLDIVVRDDEVVIKCDLAIAETHPLYSIPTKDFRCFMAGEIFFDGASSINYEPSGQQPSIGPDGSKDLGNIDSFVIENTEVFFLSGSWGSLILKAKFAGVRIN